MKPLLWKSYIRSMMYEELVRQFGKYSTWENVSSPGKGLDKAFDKFCDAFASLIGAKSGLAVRHQILFALPCGKGRTHKWNRGHARTGILNMAAAIEAHFIESDSLPTVLEAQY